VHVLPARVLVRGVKLVEVQANTAINAKVLVLAMAVMEVRNVLIAMVLVLRIAINVVVMGVVSFAVE
jgi:hypothetical protein